jgi:hypothetical protein
MTMLDEAARNTDEADLVILANVEVICDQKQPATASAVASLIGGAPVAEVQKRLTRLTHYGVVQIELGNPHKFWLSLMGVELLQREIEGWSPSVREQRRRDEELTAVLSNPYRRTG